MAHWKCSLPKSMTLSAGRYGRSHLMGTLFAVMLTQVSVAAQTTTTTTTTSTTSIPTKPSYQYIFPRFVNSPSQSMGLALLNLTDKAADITFKAYSNNGVLLASNQRTLLSNKQFTQIAGEIFEGLGEMTGWMALQVAGGSALDYFIMFDYALTAMTGSIAPEKTRDFVFPESDDGELSLVNPSNDSVNCTLEYISESGSAGHPINVSVPGSCRITVDIASLRPSRTAFGYTRVTAGGEGIFPLAAVGKPGWMLAPVNVYPARYWFPESRILYAPQYVIGGEWATVMDIVNLEERDAITIALKLLADNGEQIGMTGTVTIPPRGSLRVDNPSIFGIAAGPDTVQGYVELKSAGGAFTGWVRFSDVTEKRFGSALQFVSSGLTEMRFPHVAQNELYYTGLSVINPNSQVVTVTVFIYDTNGNQVASATHQIAPGGRLSKILTELFGPLPSLSKGHFRVGTHGGYGQWPTVTGFASIGTNSGSVLTVMPPRPTYTTTSTAVPITTTTIPR